MDDRQERRVGILETKVSDLDMKTRIMERDFLELKATTQKLGLSLYAIEKTLTQLKWAAYGVLGTILVNSIGLLPFLQKLLGL